MSLEVRPATADLWDDVRKVLQPKQSAHTCWCMAWRLSTGDYGRMTAQERGEHLRNLTEKADPPPGVLGFLDGDVAGWCNVAPRRQLDRLTSSKTITPVDDVPVWSVTCFVVRKEFRGKGVASGLLEGAVEHARANGAPAVEGYPVDPEGGRVNPTLAYVGTMDMFERAGFRRLRRTEAKSDKRHRWIMRRDLV
ncbi:MULTISPECIES: GNAT family N-acetyltransferase [Streptomyces]|uniref:GNAT family N-acetyltransferase n=1 Tax=Streptomyces yangpuensis TaxID=1648182 RepID=A0ABY5PRJ7_9ACTN|nr:MULTISPECIES: GNAT family N-acetyltransferase [Streptomyces]MBZ9594418.1 GNAT family N-acetyltransferase [Streptomyces erythrochromogenes]UUY46510.1 GNAT family N-acetyltransferase [Streptomyces yangpuensis]